MIGFNVNINKEKITNLLSDTLRKAVSANKYDINGFNLELKLKSNINLQLIGKQVVLSLPLDLEMTRQGGLFTVAAHGSIMVNLVLQYEITPGFQLLTKTGISGYNWVNVPVIDVGALDIPAEKIIDLMIKHYDSVICGSIDKAIKENVDLRQQVNRALHVLEENLKSASYFGLQIFVNPYEVLFEPISEQKQSVLLKGAVKLEAAVSDVNPFSKPNLLFTWAENILEDNINFIHLDLKEEIISSILCDYLNNLEYGGEKLKTQSCVVDFAGNGNLDLRIRIDHPVAGNISIQGRPKYNESNETITMDELKVEVKPDNFIYKLTAPLLSKYLLSEINKNLPLAIDGILDKYTSPFKSKMVEVSQLSIHTGFGSIMAKEIQLDDAGVKGILQIDELRVNISY